MKITNVQIINFLNAIPELRSLEMPIKLAYAVKKNHRIMVDHYHDYEMIYKDIDKQFPEKNDPGWAQGINELLNIENDVEIATVDASILDLDFKITLGLLDVIDFMIDKGGSDNG